MDFPGLLPAAVGPDSPLRRAQRFLASAHDSVSGLFETTYPALRSQRAGVRGRLTHAEHDVFRAGIVFTGAGIDAVFKEALKSTIYLQIEQSSDAGEVRRLRPALHPAWVGDRRKTLAGLMARGEPASELKREYLAKLTRPSLQSVDQVITSVAALGLNEHKNLFKEAQSLRPLFKVRNQIAHELDMTEASIKGRGVRRRHERTVRTYVNLCHVGLDYSQQVLNILESELMSGAG